MKRAADLAEALYAMPRNPSSLSSSSRSPAVNSAAAAAAAAASFNGYPGHQLAVSVHDAAAVNCQWDEGWSHRYPTFGF